MMIILQRIESRGKKGRKRSAWPRVNSKDRGIFWARATGSLHCLKFQVVRVPVGQEVGPRANMTRVRIPWRNWCMKRGGQGRKEGRKVEEGGRVSYYFRFAYAFRVSVHYVRSGAHQRRARSKKGRARERKGGREGSVRNRNILLLPHTPNIEAKYARTVTDKVVVVAAAWKTIFLPFSPPTKRIKGIERIARPVCPPIVRSNRRKIPDRNFVNRRPIFSFQFPFLSFLPERKKEKKNRFSKTCLEISIDRKIYRWILGLMGGWA